MINYNQQSESPVYEPAGLEEWRRAVPLGTKVLKFQHILHTAPSHMFRPSQGAGAQHCQLAAALQPMLERSTHPHTLRLPQPEAAPLDLCAALQVYNP